MNDKGHIRNETIENVPLETELTNFVFTGCTFKDMSFVKPCKHVDFKQCTFINVTFHNVYNVVLKECKCTNITFQRRSAVKQITFQQCQMKQSDFSHVVFHRLICMDTLAKNVCFDYATLQDTLFKNSKWSSCSFLSTLTRDMHTQHTLFQACHMNNGTWSRCLFEHSKWFKSQFHSNTLAGNDVQQCNFQDCVLEKNNWTNNVIIQTTFLQCSFDKHIQYRMKWANCVWRKCRMPYSSIRQSLFTCCRFMNVWCENSTLAENIFESVMEIKVSWKNTTFTNVKKTLLKTLVGRCMFKNKEASYEVECIPYADHKLIPLKENCMVRSDKPTFFMKQNIARQVDFIHVVVKPSWFPYSTQDDIFEMISKIKCGSYTFLPGTYTVGTNTLPGFVKSTPMQRTLSF